MSDLLLIFGHGLLGHLLANKLNESLSRRASLAVQGDRNAIGDNLEPCGTPGAGRGDGGRHQGRGGTRTDPAQKIHTHTWEDRRTWVNGQSEVIIVKCDDEIEAKLLTEWPKGCRRLK